MTDHNSPEFDLENLRSELAACRVEIVRLRRENARLHHELDKYRA